MQSVWHVPSVVNPEATWLLLASMCLLVEVGRRYIRSISRARIGLIVLLWLVSFASCWDRISAKYRHLFAQGDGWGATVALVAAIGMAPVLPIARVVQYTADSLI